MPNKYCLGIPRQAENSYVQRHDNVQPPDGNCTKQAGPFIWIQPASLRPPFEINPTRGSKAKGFSRLIVLHANLVKSSCISSFEHVLKQHPPVIMIPHTPVQTSQAPEAPHLRGSRCVGSLGIPSVISLASYQLE